MISGDRDISIKRMNSREREAETEGDSMTADAAGGS